MVKHFSKKTSVSEITEGFTVEVWQQPFWHWLIAAIYHWYDMRIGKVPGFKLLEKLLERFSREESLIYIPLSARQDLRCYHLDNKDKKVLAKFKVESDSEIVRVSWPS